MVTRTKIKTKIAFWIWRNLSGGTAPFYKAFPEKSLTHLEPTSVAWFGWKLKIWKAAVDYLLKVGELTHTPTLKEKF